MEDKIELGRSVQYQVRGSLWNTTEDKVWGLVDPSAWNSALTSIDGKLWQTSGMKLTLQLGIQFGIQL